MESGLFSELSEHSSGYSKVKDNHSISISTSSYNFDAWYFYAYEDLFVFSFRKAHDSYNKTQFVIVDIRETGLKRRHMYIGVQQVLETAPEPLKKFLVFNLDLF
jgi:hypothetical protein